MGPRALLLPGSIRRNRMKPREAQAVERLYAVAQRCEPQRCE